MSEQIIGPGSGCSYCGREYGEHSNDCYLKSQTTIVFGASNIDTGTPLHRLEKSFIKLFNEIDLLKTRVKMLEDVQRTVVIVRNQ